MELEGDAVVGSFTNAASLKSGITWSINKDTSIQVTTSYGLTEDSPDFTLEVNFPITF